MNRQERIRLDEKNLHNMGYKKVQFKGLYDYFNNIETCTTKYICKKGKDKYTQYICPNELNPKEIWKNIEKELDAEVLSYHEDFREDGLIYNALIEKDNNKSILLIKYIPTTKEIIIKEIEYNNETDA